MMQDLVRVDAGCVFGKQFQHAKGRDGKKAE
jgi:hypothetical protein